jgi:dTDP-glucose pyrophosphorylase
MRAAADRADLAPAQAQMADAGLKAMVPFERPFLDYLLHNLAESGISRACIVIGPAHGAVRDYYERMPTRRLGIEFAIQPAPHGTADAVLAAGTFIGEDAVLVVNGDNLYPVASCRALVEHGAPAVAAFSRADLLADGLISPERIQKFAVIVARQGWLEHVIEKPDAATLAAFGDDVYVSMNSWVVPPGLRAAVARLPFSPRGELELPLAMQALVDSGVRVRVFPSNEPVLDLSNRGDIAGLESRLRGREVLL